MKKIISITNHTGCRNRGCEALVLSKIHGFKKHFKDIDVEFRVHTNDPVFDSWRLSKFATSVFSYLIATPNHFKSKIINNLIYNLLAIFEKITPKKLKGISFNTIEQLKESDIIIPTGGDIFTSDYHNLRKHLAYILAAKTKKIYLCGHTIGPFEKEDENYFKKVVEYIDLITVRESESYEYLKSLNLNTPVYRTADVAFTLPTFKKDEAFNYINERFGITDKENLVAISVSQGIIKYSNLDSGTYYKEFAKFVNYLNTLGKKVLFIPHVMEKNPSNNDVVACESVYKLVEKQNMNKIIFGEPSAVELKGIIGICECLIGTRTHSTIASLSQCIPTVSVAYSRKAYGIMKDVFGEEKYESMTVSVKGLKYEKLVEAYNIAIITPPNYDVIKSIKELAEENFTRIDEIL